MTMNSGLCSLYHTINRPTGTGTGKINTSVFLDVFENCFVLLTAEAVGIPMVTMIHISSTLSLVLSVLSVFHRPLSQSGVRI